MTPMKNVIFSRVRTILEDFQAVAREPIRSCIFDTDMSMCESVHGPSTDLELQLLELAVDILPCSIGLRCLGGKIVTKYLSSGLELVCPLRELSLEEIDAGIPVRFHCVCKGGASKFKTHFAGK